VSRQLSGLKAWIIQRVTALYIALFTIIAVSWFFLTNKPLTYQNWSDLIASPLINLAIATFFVALLLHAWIGARDVIVDYISAVWLRMTLLGLTAIFMIICGLWALQILFTRL